MKHSHEPTSEALMARYQRRLDAEAFGQLVSRFLAPGLAVARQALAERALAEDAVQEAFLRIVRSRERYDIRKPFSAWFYAILRNVCTDMLRRRARQTTMMKGLAARAKPQVQEPAHASVDAADLLALLPDDARTVLARRIVHDLPFRDVAAALGISEEAAKKRAQRALRQLRKLCTREPLRRAGPPSAPLLAAVGQGCRQQDVPGQAP